MNIGFIGLGRMGLPMAGHLIRGGHELVVHDIRKQAAGPLLEAGALWAETPRAVAETAEVIFTSLPGPTEIESVVLGQSGIAEGVTAGAVCVDLSTCSPALIERIHDALEPRGVFVLDAPVSGGAAGAIQKTLAVYVGGDPAAFERVRALLELIGDKVSYLGGSGSGSVAKLVHNMISITSRVAVAEGLTLGVKAGINPEVLRQAVEDGSFGQGNLLRRRIPDVVFKRDWADAGSTLDTAAKDMRLALELGGALEVPLQLASLAAREMELAAEAGWGALDPAASMMVQERRAGVELRVDERDVGR
jgi:3-hydroxyisobutyrate dehydrogenase